jgi:hypothetical protein
MNNAMTAQSRAVFGLATGVVILLAVIWILGMSHVIQLPLALVWIIPFTCLVLGAIVVLWAGGAFSNR